MARKCPTPGKAAYGNRSKAESALHSPRLAQTYYSPTRTYKCPCGQWHLTAKPRAMTGRR